MLACEKCASAAKKQYLWLVTNQNIPALSNIYSFKKYIFPSTDQ
jgi:hypothetical protein